jgi:hypothetical protein
MQIAFNEYLKKELQDTRNFCNFNVRVKSVTKILITKIDFIDLYFGALEKLFREIQNDNFENESKAFVEVFSKAEFIDFLRSNCTEEKFESIKEEYAKLFKIIE